MAKRIRLKPAFFAVLLAAGTACAAGISLLITGSAAKRFDAMEQQMPETALDAVLKKAQSGDLEQLYENTVKKYPSLDSKETYIRAMQTVFSDAGSGISTALMKQEGDTASYALSSDGKAFGIIELTKTAEGWEAAMPMQGNEVFSFQIPQGITAYIGNVQLDDSYKKETNIVPDNYFANPTASYVPAADVYEVTGLIDVPELTDQNGNRLGTLKDAITGNVLVGREVTDKETLQYIIDAAETLAAFPAQDVSLAAVSAVADTGAGWYRKYVTLPNYWFTSHSVSRFSDEEVHAIQQSDDTICSQVIFDYYAENSEVNRTWHIGYQLTFRKIEGKWKICDTAINNELNPRTEAPE